MMAYKPYKPVPLSCRCPHGYNATECKTCADAKNYWSKLPAPLHPSSAIGNGYTEAQLKAAMVAAYEEGKQAALARVDKPSEPSEPIGEIVAEDMGKPFNAIQIRTHFYKEVPAIGTKLFTNSSPSKPAPLPELQREELLGAIARGWRTDRNMHKIMDSGLAFDIADSILAAAREKK